MVVLNLEDYLYLNKLEVKSNKDIRLLVRKIISEVELNMAGGATGWDSNNDISFFHGYPSGYGEFPFLHVDTPNMLPNAEEVNAEFENKTRFPLDKFTFGLDYERKINNNNQSEFDLARLVIDNLQKDENYYETKND